MLPTAGQTAGPNGLNFSGDTNGWPRGVLYIFFYFKFFLKFFFHGQRRALQLVGNKTLNSWVITHLNFKQILGLFSKVVYGIQFSKCHYGFSGLRHSA